MWSTALDVILTTLRYLAPATLLTLFWGQQSFLFKLLKYIDSAFRTLIFSNEEQKQSILQWLAEAGPVRVDDLEVVWRHGWIVCGVLDTALPGACAGHPPTSLSLKHAQAIADHYLGVEPAFTRQELEANDSLSKLQEWKLVSYLENIRVALSKLTPPNTKSMDQITEKASSRSTHYTLNYIARGSGLTAAQVNNKVYFKIYPTAQQSLDPGEITVLINGPKETYGMTVVTPVLGKAQMIRQNLLGLQTKTTYTENVLPITQGTTYLRNYGKNDMNKTFHIPKTKYDIDIEIELKQDHARIGYVASLEGNYEISITNRGQNIVGSPFIVTASKDIVEILERDSFCLEDGEEIDIVDVKTDRKVVLRIVDFVTEKMLLRENGTLEKISDEDAKFLMENDEIKNITDEVLVQSNKTKHGAFAKINMKSKKFYNSVNKVLTANRFCNMLNDIKNKQNLTLTNYDSEISKNKRDVPDIVNSTYSDDRMKTCQKEKRDRIIIPENISVSLLTEKPHQINQYNDHELEEFLRSECANNNNIYVSDPFEDDNISVDTVQSSNNPFLSDIVNENYGIEKTFGSFITNEFESNNSQNEETAKASVKIVIENETSSEATNPFLDVIEMERPKTPVYKIITGDITDRDGSVYIDQENMSNEIIFRRSPNPFIDQEIEQINSYQEKPDFIIGAPVSLPPIVNLKSSTSSVNNNDNKISKIKQKKNNKVEDVYDYKGHITDSTEMPILSADTDKSSNNSNFGNSLDSNLTEDINISPNSSPTPSNASNRLHTSRETSPRKDTWDSAYVSIDDNHFTENSEINSETLNKKLQLSKEHSKLNFVAKEQDLKDVTNAVDDYYRQKSDKRSECMPIIEENEKVLFNSTKDKTVEKNEADPVAIAFSDINDMYDDLFKNSEVSSETTTLDCKSQNLEIDFTLERNENYVDSASEFRTDVKRQTKILEGKISEIQANVTESVSVSRNLRAKGKQYYKEENNNENIDRTTFGDPKYTNIVLEKKKYWDERIRQIEAAKSDEIKSQQHRRRLTSKHLRRNDSLSKRRGKKIVQNFLSLNQDECNSFKQSINQLESIDVQNNLNLDKNEKRCINNNMEINQSESMSCFGKTSSDDKDRSVLDTFKQLKVSSVDLVDTAKDNDDPSPNLHLKQELSEKLFQAFETSPKRFFGTSRKHILNKIDTFLGLPDNETETKKITSDITHETGLVSSRISLFHNISQTEELPWSRRKCVSMYNITHQDSEKQSHHISKSKTIQNSQNVTEKEIRRYSTSYDEPNTRVEKSEKNEPSLKEKRARMIQNKYNKSFDETLYTPANYIETTNDYVKRTINDYNKQNEPVIDSTSKLKSISKSEMDIFNKITTTPEEVLEKHKSYEELPKINVKSFISLYESVSKTSIMKNPTSRRSRINFGSTNSLPVPCSIGTANKLASPTETLTHSSLEASISEEFIPLNERVQRLQSKTVDYPSSKPKNYDKSLDVKFISNQDKDNDLILSDIEIEIIEKDPEKTSDSPIEKEAAHLEYKNRFAKAKQYFQSLEELREVKKTITVSKRQSLTNSLSTESLEENKRPRKRSNIKKSRSMPSSEISKIWNQMQETEAENKKLVKISEKFNVDDLFEDVMEGRLSRQGSLRGIPHKKAVLETFRSMENISDNKLNSYELAVSQLNDFAEENKIKNAQTYLSEYPYLPTTDPSKYHSRLDTNASGLITLKELKKIPRRNSVPDLRLNPSFTADL